MQVKISKELCEGNAVCVALAPQVFAQNGVGEAYLTVEVVRAEDEADVWRAIDGCPRLAISLVD